MNISNIHQTQIKTYAEIHFCKDSILSNFTIVDNEVSILIETKGFFAISPYIIHRFAIDLYSIGLQIYLGWEFIFVHVVEQDKILIQFKVLNLY